MEALIKVFDNYISREGNNNIILSAPFGTGKSYFINEFSIVNLEKYHFIKIIPVNYSVSSNEDIFELINFDIVLQILGNKELSDLLSSEEYKLAITTQMYLIENSSQKNIFKLLLSVLDKIKKPATNLLVELIRDIKIYNQDAQVNEEKILENYMEEFESEKGTIYEFNSISRIISKVIKFSNKPVVLIIDDLDRMDPEHIFRILNIFSSYNDPLNGNNKFGFHKLILVCDIENIRSVFHHRFGNKADFAGYLNKFYSRGVFEFENKVFVKNLILERLSQIDFLTNVLCY